MSPRASSRSATWTPTRCTTPQQFFEAANELETTFNMAYVDSKNTSPTSRPGACRSSRRAPTRACRPSAPGEYDWQGFLVARTSIRTKSTRPASVLLNWNNKPAPEWGAASDEYSYGPVHRVQLYTGFTTKA